MAVDVCPIGRVLSWVSQESGQRYVGDSLQTTAVPNGGAPRPCSVAAGIPRGSMKSTSEPRSPKKRPCSGHMKCDLQHAFVVSEMAGVGDHVRYRRQLAGSTAESTCCSASVRIRYVSKSVIDVSLISDTSDLSSSVRAGYAHPKQCGVTKFTIAVHIERAIGDKGESVEDCRM